MQLLSPGIFRKTDGKVNGLQKEEGGLLWGKSQVGFFTVGVCGILLVLVLVRFFLSLTQGRAIWEEGASAEELPSPVSANLGHFLDSWLMWEDPVYCG